MVTVGRAAETRTTGQVRPPQLRIRGPNTGETRSEQKTKITYLLLYCLSEAGNDSADARAPAVSFPDWHGVDVIAAPGSVVGKCVCRLSPGEDDSTRVNWFRMDADATNSGVGIRIGCLAESYRLVDCEIRWRRP